ncbi:hypothetical protein NA56DRAFT_147976 [Hyaloscypha hepaticicola]|uniref:Heterokaryon incompatibility domain-containing protein n=1 Tax=Hyaloscypha hepaticicola TaxID=2082293 RepID=A0A2J6QNI3_9HELO|nr:hypothetical protein NA56DRAFT_147976 [Hyaloscypha hepaticicola]
MAATPLERSRNDQDSPEPEPNEGFDSDADYRYKSLESGQIRLVNLFQHRETAPELLSGCESLWCALENVEALNAAYTAISYEWGSQDKPFSILVMDRDKNRLGGIRITATLKNVLLDLMQSPVEPKVFWIDQLCIDQSDPQDKSIQIPEMGTIYRDASQVLTYLGPAEAGDPEGLELMDQICRHYEPMLISLAGSKRITPSVVANLWDLFERSPEKKLRVEPEKPAWTNLCRMLLTGWLKRRWMVQENMLNKNTFFLRGPRILKLANGGLIVQCIIHGSLPRPTEERLSSVITRYGFTIGGIESGRDMNFNMFDLLFWFCQTECHDPRDRIFALLGAASDATGLNIIVDYSRTENEILINLATRMVEYHRNLDILKVPLTAERDLPSWVPYWDEHDLIYTSEIRNASRLNAAGEFNIRCAFENEGKILTLKGLRLGTLEASLGYSGSSSLRVNYVHLLRGEAIEEVRQQVKVLNQIQERWGNSKDYEYALACTLVSASPLSQYNEVDSKEAPREGVLRAFRNCLKLLKHSLESTASQSSEQFSYSAAASSPTSMTDNEKQMAVKFIRDIFIHNRAFWTINGRHLCLAPAAARAGDLATVLLGGPLLYELRPTKDEGKYLFIGTAYVHGFMQGEAVQSPNWEQELETFRLV